MRNVESAVSILIVLGLLTSGTGCQVLGIPSYRSSAGSHGVAPQGFEPHGFDIESIEIEECGLDCPPGILPPLPGWLAAWHEKKKLPDPPTYPRFHPLPTRPMFRPTNHSNHVEYVAGFDHPQSPLGSKRYGELPSPTSWQDTTEQNSSVATPVPH